jgi:hypothetical protein
MSDSFVVDFELRSPERGPSFQHNECAKTSLRVDVRKRPIYTFVEGEYGTPEVALSSDLPCGSLRQRWPHTARGVLDNCIPSALRWLRLRLRLYGLKKEA